MKKLFALLLTLCMLGSCVAFAEAPAEEADPKTAMADMIDQVFYGVLNQVSGTFNQSANAVEGVIANMSEMLSSWLTDADSRYTETRDALADGALNVMNAATEIAGEAQYVFTDDEISQKYAEVQSSIQQLTDESKELSITAAHRAGDRLAENKDQVVAAGSAALSNVLNTVKSLMFVLSGSNDSEAQTRMGEVADSATELVTAFVESLQQQLANYTGTEAPAVGQ